MKSQPYTIIPTEKFNKELHQQILYVAMQFSKETAIQVKENIQNSILNVDSKVLAQLNLIGFSLINFNSF